jgi:hypothetical protein
MSEDLLERQRQAAATAKAGRAVPYTAKDFQLEVLGQLAEMQAISESLQETVRSELKRRQDESQLLRFDGRTLVAIGAIALSLTGYVVENARNSTKRDAELESAMARLTILERTSAMNTEARIRTEVEMDQIREGVAEIKALVESRPAKPVAPQK